MSYVNKRTVLFLPFQYECLLFPFIVFLHCSELPSKGWIKVMRTDLFAFFLALEGKCVISYWFLQMFFNKLRKSSLFLFFCELYHEQMLNFLKCFFCINWYDHVIFLLFSLFIWWIGLPSVCLQCGRPGLDSWVGKFPWRRNGNPLQHSCLENPMDGGAW